MGMFGIDRANFYAKPQDSPCTPYFFLYIGRIWQRSRLSWVGPLFHSSWNSIHIQNISLNDSILYVWKITISDRNFLFSDNFLLSLYKDLELFNNLLLWLTESSLSSMCCISVSDHHHMSIRVPCKAKGSIAKYVRKKKKLLCCCTAFNVLIYNSILSSIEVFFGRVKSCHSDPKRTLQSWLLVLMRFAAKNITKIRV